MELLAGSYQPQCPYHSASIVSRYWHIDAPLGPEGIRPECYGIVFPNVFEQGITQPMGVVWFEAQRIS